MKLTVRDTFVLIWIAALISFIAAVASSDSLAGQEAKEVFVLHSYHQGYPFTDNETRGIFDALGKSDIKIETYVTYMDTKRIPVTSQYFAQIKELIKKGYKGVRFHAVLVCDNDALDFMRKYRDELFPEVPVVFTGINDFNERMLDGRKDITGITENADYAGTIRIALKLRPATKNIVVVTDDTTTGKAHRAEIEKIRPDFPQSLGFTYLSLADTTLNELAQKLSKLNSDNIVLLVQHFVDKNGISYSVQEGTVLLAKSSSVPVFVTTDSRMGLGVLGGHLIGGYFQGETAAQVVLQILRGADVSSIPIVLESPNRYLFDYRVMQRFNIAESDLPQESILVNKPVSILDEYRPYLIIVFCAFIVLSGILVYLLLEIRKRKKIEGELRESQIKYSRLIDTANEGVWAIDENKKTTFVNPRMAQMLGYDPEEMIGQTVDSFLFQEDLADHAERMIKRCHGESEIYERRFRKKDGQPLWAINSAAPLMSTTGQFQGAFAMVTDVSERRNLENQLRQSQKMESIGILAGGIAHDFNNILSAIIGYGNLVLMKMAKDEPQRLNIEYMLEASDRAAHLTKDLLLFSRKQIGERKPIDLNDIIRKVENFLKRVIGEDIECRKILGDEVFPILGDQHQIEQVFVNLATNARDAMPKGGIFTITTDSVKLDDEFFAVQGHCKPGKYVLAIISDTGQGIEERTRQHIFDPFFTTKGVGKGTGLGLAVVYGIVKQHEGFIDVYSEPGMGTTFKIYLPLIAAQVAETKAAKEQRPTGGTETILLAEDEKMVRDLTRNVLEEFGYRIITANDGQDAVEKYKENKDRINLLLFDLVMPKKMGNEAYDEISAITPGVKVLFMSGYAPDMARQRLMNVDMISVVNKPISPNDLLKRIRETLDQ
jgi:two-component system cell cycle sensor histidine kinase/response regulator CckA